MPVNSFWTMILATVIGTVIAAWIIEAWKQRMAIQNAQGDTDL